MREPPFTPDWVTVSVLGEPDRKFATWASACRYLQMRADPTVYVHPWSEPAQGEAAVSDDAPFEKALYSAAKWCNDGSLLSNRYKGVIVCYKLELG